MGLVRLRTAGAQAGHIAGQVPALAFVELVGERRHVGAGHARADDVTQVVEAQVVEALAIGEVRRRRFQADAGGAVALARIAMADRALLGIDRRRAARVGGDRGGLHHLVDIRHPCLEVARLEGHVPSRQALLDGLAQAGDPLSSSARSGRIGRVRTNACRLPTNSTCSWYSLGSTILPSATVGG